MNRQLNCIMRLLCVSLLLLAPYCISYAEVIWTPNQACVLSQDFANDPCKLTCTAGAGICANALCFEINGIMSCPTWDRFRYDIVAHHLCKPNNEIECSSDTSALLEKCATARYYLHDPTMPANDCMNFQQCSSDLTAQGCTGTRRMGG